MTRTDKIVSTGIVIALAFTCSVIATRNIVRAVHMLEEIWDADPVEATGTSEGADPRS